MRHLPLNLLGLLCGAFAVPLVAACSQESTSPRAGGGETSNAGGTANGSNGGAGDQAGGTTGASGAGNGSPGAPTTSADGGLAGSSGGADAGLPPPSLPPQPNGFQETIAPLLDAQGCTECHHHGRSIDLTTYPFMTGTAAATAQQLVAAFTTGMPPAPRTAAPQTVIDQVNAWVAAGMKP
jgi:hypothetical protein